MYGNPTLSASEVTSAESTAETVITVVPADGTVARGGTPPAAAAHTMVAEVNPLPEFGHSAGHESKPESSSELPSLV